MTITQKLSAVITLLLLTSLACARFSGAAPTVPSSLPVGESMHTLTHNGRERSYILYVPASADLSQPLPLVFVFHGGTGNAKSAIRMSGFHDIADQNGFIVVYPNGTSGLSDDILLTWNGGACCAYAQRNNVDDVGFVRAIVADVQSSALIDAKRIYATGMSNGGMMSHRLGCEASDLFAAIAPVAGTLNFLPCQPAQPVPVIAFHGTGDQNVPYDGGLGLDALTDVDFASVPDSMAIWVSANGCAPQPQNSTAGSIQHEVWVDCTSSASVELYTIIGGGHAWPGGVQDRRDADKPTSEISASQLIWEFFAAHPKQ